MSRNRLMALLVGLALPWIFYVVISPFFNFAEPKVLGMPPLMFVDVIGIVLTSVFLFIAYYFEVRGGIIE